jgi:pilus assembly protein CpaC
MGRAPTGRQPLKFKVSATGERLEMIINTSRIITTEYKIPQVLVDNDTVIRAQPISPNQVQISALRTGFTTLTIWDDKQQEFSIDILVYGDARELKNLLMTEFPDASLRVRPLTSSVVISGYVPQVEMVSRIIAMAEDYYPSVINNMTVGGVQQIMLHVKVMEVSRTKLRKMGFDWALFTGNDSIIQSASGLILGGGGAVSSGGETLAASVMDGGSSFLGFLEALRQYNMVKILAEPTLVTISGRPASFSSGGEFPILVPQSLGTVSVEYREFGTRVDFVPIVLGNGRIRLEVRPQISEIDPSRSVTINNTTVPGLRTRWVDTAVEMNAGQTLALAGLIQTQTETENKGLPWLSDLPWIGGAFRRIEEKYNEIELLILVTPEFVSALDPHEVAPCGPGQLTERPSDVDFYYRGYVEVPKCCDGGGCQQCHGTVKQANYQPLNERTIPSQSYQNIGPPLRSNLIPARATSTGNLRIRRQPAIPASQIQTIPTGPPTLIGPFGYDDFD